MLGKFRAFQFLHTSKQNPTPLIVKEFENFISNIIPLIHVLLVINVIQLSMKINIPISDILSVRKLIVY